MENKIKVHEQLLELLNEKYITRGEYLLSIKDSLFSLGDKVKIHEQLDELLQNGYITKDEYLIFIKENLNSNKETKTNFSTKTTKNEYTEITKMKNRIILAGKNALTIFYCIIFQLFLFFVYWFVIGFKEGYNNARGYSEDITSQIKFIERIDLIFYSIELILFIVILNNLWRLGINLKNVGRE